MPGYGDQTDLTLAPVSGRPPDQVAYVVNDLEAAARKLGRMYGVRRWLGWRYTADYLPERRYRGEPGDFESWGVVAEYGPSLEIIAPLYGHSVFTEFLNKHGSGLHHLGWFVPSLADEHERLTAGGWEQVQFGGGHGIDGDGAIGYYESVGPCASYLEVIEPPRRRHAPHFEFTFDAS